MNKETSVVRDIILNQYPDFKDMSSIDIGFGGDKFLPNSIGVDLPTPYGVYTGYQVDIPCNVLEGVPVEDKSYDIVYSSHLIEDFVDTKKILDEFIRIAKNYLVLVFPDQIRYEQQCRVNGTIPNGSHKIKNMGLDYMEKIMSTYSNLEIEYKKFVAPYNCIIIAKVK